MGSITSDINDEVRASMEDAIRQSREMTAALDTIRDKNMMILEYSSAALIGLLSSGKTSAYSTAHEAFSMGKMMAEISEQYIKPVKLEDE